MGPQTWFWRHSTGKLMRKKMRCLLGFVDLICFKVFNIRILSAEIKHKNGHNSGQKKSPDMNLTPFEGKFDEKKDEIPPGICRPHMLQFFQYWGVGGWHKTQKSSYIAPQSVFKGENLTQCFLTCLQRLWYTQRKLKYIYLMSFKAFGGSHIRGIILLIGAPY